MQKTRVVDHLSDVMTFKLIVRQILRNPKSMDDLVIHRIAEEFDSLSHFVGASQVLHENI